FRKAFWLEVSRDPVLLEQFISNNRASMRKGNAPYTRTPDSVGKRERYEIHHIQPISQGGKVYDVDNMGITTPKHHIKIHKGE
ncbi:HNH endonuclease signature motif containing protein, partial [Enterobacter cloacae subsp. cloacae]